jgi:uncharacterized coiled-coil protein SlyX
VPVEKEPKPNAKDERIAELEGELAEANEKIASLETMVNEEWMTEVSENSETDAESELQDELDRCRKIIELLEKGKEQDAEALRQLTEIIGKLDPSIVLPFPITVSTESVIIVPAEPGQVKAPVKPRAPAPTNTGFAHITLATPSNKFKVNTRTGVTYDPKKHPLLIDAVLARGEFDFTLDRPDDMSDEGKRIHRILTTLGLHGLRAQREREAVEACRTLA